MMLSEPEPRMCVTMSILTGLREGLELLRFRPQSEFSYSFDGYCRGDEIQLLGWSSEAVQEFPVILAGFEQAERMWGRIARWGRRKVGATEAGEFLFAVPPTSVRVGYSVRWERGAVSELTIELPAATQELATAAHAELRRLVRQVWPMPD